jgi:hypothetical protein
MATTLRMMPGTDLVIDQWNIAAANLAAQRQQRIDAILIDHARNEGAEDAAAFAHFGQRRLGSDNPSRTAGDRNTRWRRA